MNLKNNCQYVLDHPGESERLERQEKMAQYRVHDELKKIEVEKHSSVLDAGCGTGVVARYLAKKFPQCHVSGCDTNDLRLKYAQKECQEHEAKDINFFKADIQNFESHYYESFNYVFNRYVFHHLQAPQEVCSQFYQILKPGGQVCIIDIDGILFNIYASNERFMKLHKYLIRHWCGGDLNAGRKIPSWLKQCGFQNIQTQPILMTFQGDDLRDERALYEERLNFMKNYPLFNIFYDDETVEEYIDLYLKALRAPDTVIFYNKFIVTAMRP